MPSIKRDDEREVIHERIVAKTHAGDRAITAEMAKKILGWEEEKEGDKFGGTFLLKDERGTKVRCQNNLKNRPLVWANVRSLMQEILCGRWRMNGEPAIVGQTGQVLNGQHTLVALVLAVQAYEKDPDRWQHVWDSQPTIDKLIVYGIEETDEVVNTLDTGRPRSLADVIYRSAHFSSFQEKRRKRAAKICDNAVRFLWERTGASADAFSPLRTHSESLDFIARHPGILECVKHVMEEDGDGRLAKLLHPGYAAGLLYLMASSATDPKEYREAQSPDENSLSWDRFEDAQKFWTLVAADAQELRPMRAYLGSLGGGTRHERIAVMAKAWLAFSEGKKITAASVKLRHGDDDGVRTLAECPTVGGIDVGRPEQAEPEDDPTPDQIEKAKRSLKKKAMSGLKGSMKGNEWQKGDSAWVRVPDGNHYFCEVDSVPWQRDDTGELLVMVKDQSGRQWEEKLADLKVEHPDLDGSAA